MHDLKQFFSYMNEIDFPYVVLRNWDNLPYSVELGIHSDLDLLVYDFKHFKEIFPEAVSEYQYPRVRHKMKLDEGIIYMDVRHIGDDYYPEDFEQNILKYREWNSKGFFTPDPVHHRIALAYHAVHHKNENKYERWLGPSTITELLEALQSTAIGWVAPKDKSVGRFNPYWKGATAVVSREDGLIKKKQTNFSKYDLISNEYRILSGLNSSHFPKVINYVKDDHVLIIEDCGEILSPENLPADWQDQLADIIAELHMNKIIHRDVRPDNLMVLNGVIKLIDFGWSKFEDDPEDNPPECLGFPFKPSYGFDDGFSMKKVMKQLEFSLEEKDANIGY